MIATPEMIAAAWASWHSRHGGRVGPGPGFVEAIEAALAAGPALDAIETLTRALRRIAKQKLTSEIGDDELVVNDIEGGYDACILEARAVVEKEKPE